MIPGDFSAHRHYVTAHVDYETNVVRVQRCCFVEVMCFIAMSATSLGRFIFILFTARAWEGDVLMSCFIRAHI